jgi:hypothetical protein
MGGSHRAVSDPFFASFFFVQSYPGFYSLQGELILAMTYGYYEVSGRNDKMIDAARKLSDLGTSIVLPGALLVNNLPFRAFHPNWHVRL